MADRSFCAATSERLGEDLAGTASTVRAFLLLEHGGPWGQTVLRHAAFPDGVRERLQQACAAAGVRLLLTRRPGARPGIPDRPRLLLAACDAAGGHAVQTRLDDVRAAPGLPLADLLAAVRSGAVPQGWERVTRFLGTCTHGRHDACCAERGRPVARALHELVGDDAWEVSHIGGDRFAGNVLALPDGIYYGRVPAFGAPDLVTAHGDGRLALGWMRGRSSLPFAAQAAEVALRRHLGLDRGPDLRLEALRRSGVRTTTTWQTAGRGRWRVAVDTTNPGPARPLTCTGDDSSPPLHTVVELVPDDAPGRGVEGWDAAYTEAVADAEPSPTVTGVLDGLPPGRALDVAAGTGRHAVWLARRGWQVTAVDFSPVGVAVGHAASDAADLAVDWHVGDARVWTPPAGEGAYDLVLLAYAALPEVVRRAATWLSPGGRLVVVGHSVRNLTEESPHGPRDPRLLHTLDSLRHSASGLHVEHLEEVTRSTRHGPVVEAVLVARRPAE